MAHRVRGLPRADPGTRHGCGDRHRPGCHRHRRPLRRPEAELPPAHRQRTRPDPQTPARAARAPKGSAAKAAEHAKAARLQAREANRRKDWCEKTSTRLARSYDLIRFEKLSIKTMTRSAKGTVERPGRHVAQKSGLNRAILAQGWGLLRQRTGHKAPGRVEDVPAPYTSLRCSACGWIDKNSRKSQAEFVCSSCGFTCNADTNASINIAAGQGGIPRPRRTAGAGGTTPPNQRTNVREPQSNRVEIPLS
ncbi:transposase [Streptomyces sp. NPDC001868]|uniref:RNA-guided endonuclease InsQ/TnpB family protein n=1 Tax=Streptomyces sp. NPDC001868 TaxID=3154401 RepID=UPI003327BF14